MQFLHRGLQCQAQSAAAEAVVTEEEFEKLLDEKMALMEMKTEFKERNLNEGFSGGEKKRNEILQMAVLEPNLAILDETDSGLDIDAMRIVAKGVNHFDGTAKMRCFSSPTTSGFSITSAPILSMSCSMAKIVQSGGPELALELEEKGYDWLREFLSKPSQSALFEDER